jgi:hypothetical protein
VFFKLNEEPLARLVEGTKRPKYYSPLLRPNEEEATAPFFSLILYGVQSRREQARMLTARAMLHLGEGRPDDAWNDLLACHRLARHVASGQWLIEGLVGLAIESVAATGDVAYLAHAALTADDVRKRLRDLEALPPLPALADTINVAERVSLLDTVQLVARLGRTDILSQLGSEEIPEWVETLDPKLVDWNAALKMGNQHYDRLEAAVRIEDRSKRFKRLKDFEAEAREASEKLRARPFPDKKRLASDAEARQIAGQHIADLLIRLLIPGVTASRNAEDRARQQQWNLHVGFALAAFRAEQGRYPEKLSELSPRYLKEVPKDLFAEKELVYVPSGVGYVLYSVGQNGNDDGGYRNGEKDGADDLVIRMPAEE